MKKLLTIAALVLASAFVAGCGENDSRVVSRNLATQADNFEINRRIVFVNGITDNYLMTIEGLCSKDDTSTDRKLSITCKVGPGTYKRHLLGLSDNMSYFIEQLEPVAASSYHYRVVFKPSTLLPDVQIK
jgi:hypothetical protein